MIKKFIKKRIKKMCSVCARHINVLIYTDKTYRGGHYFGKIPIKNGKSAEFWECPKCYWGK